MTVSADNTEQKRRLDIVTASAVNGVEDAVTPSDSTTYNPPLRTLISVGDNPTIICEFSDGSQGRYFLPVAGFEGIAAEIVKVLATGTTLNGDLVGYR